LFDEEKTMKKRLVFGEIFEAVQSTKNMRPLRENFAAPRGNKNSH
jgi:hypothetical protein